MKPWEEDYGTDVPPWEMEYETPKPAPKKQGAGVKMDMAISNIPRQLGLTARHGIEGAADFAGIFSNPIAGFSNEVFGTKLPTLRDATAGTLDYLGVPKPQNATERVVGYAS